MVIWCTKLEEIGAPLKCGNPKIVCRKCPFGKKIKRNLDMRGGP